MLVFMRIIFIENIFKLEKREREKERERMYIQFFKHN